MKNLLYFLVILVSIKSYGQGFSDEKVSLTNFIKRMYTAKPFEGVKIVDDYDHQYLISVISLEKAKYTSESIMNRVAQVKAQSQASTFLNGATISMDMVITTKEFKDSTNNVKTIVETVEQIKQNSVGFSQGLELLTNFDNADNLRMVFIYIRELKKE
jgi:6-pyruvoyl-tetrahydropterin synthase